MSSTTTPTTPGQETSTNTSERTSGSSENTTNISGNNQSNNDTSLNSNSNRRNDNRKNVFTNNEKTWQGNTPDVGAVLGLRTEFLDKKVSFRVFMEKMEEHAVRKLDNGNDLIPLMREQVDPRISFENTHLPKVLTAVEKLNEVKVEVHKQRIKMYVNREIELNMNMTKIYGLVKG